MSDEGQVHESITSLDLISLTAGTSTIPGRTTQKNELTITQYTNKRTGKVEVHMFSFLKIRKQV